jgi:short-subunit dehydrogenase
VLTICPGATDTEALSRHGIDPAKLPNVMSAEEVARLALDGLKKGPVLIASEYYKATFDKLLSMPRRDALMAMAKSMKG